MISLFDLDGSLADYEGALRASLLPLQSPTDAPIPEDLWAGERHEFMRARMRLIKTSVGWWANLPRIEAGFDVVRIAAELGYKLTVLTRGPRSNPIAWKEKVEWCAKQPELEGVNMNIVADKGIVYGNILYDDFPEYMDKWITHRPRGLGIMPVNAYNYDYNHPQVFKYDGNNLAELREIMGAKIKSGYVHRG